MLESFSTKIEPLVNNVLIDLVSNIELQDNFRIYHPEYKPFDLPEGIIASVQKMPQETQLKYYSLHLRDFLYGIYYNGHLLKSLALEANSKDLSINLDNSTYLGIDQNFFEKLHCSNKGSGYFDPDWTILQEKTSDKIVVHKGDLKLHIERHHHLQSSQQSAMVGEKVAIRKPKNLIQKGFYTAVGNAGFQGQIQQQQLPETVRCYFNISAEGAITLMGILTQQLNDLGIPFSFKVLYNRADYGRYDSAVLYFNKFQYQSVRQVLNQAYAETQSSFYSEVPLFTKKLAGGLGLAEEPDSKFKGESFGENRCQIMANGLLKAILAKTDSPEAKIESIYQEFSNAKVDLSCPYLNHQSIDIYT